MKKTPVSKIEETNGYPCTNDLVHHSQYKLKHPLTKGFTEMIKDKGSCSLQPDIRTVVNHNSTRFKTGKIIHTRL